MLSPVIILFLVQWECLPLRKDGAQDPNADEAVDSLVDPSAPDSGEEDENTIRNLRQEAKCLKHLLTHRPAYKYCDACILGKMRGTKKFCGSDERSRQPTRWLELATADHLVAQNGSTYGRHHW